MERSIGLHSGPGEDVEDVKQKWEAKKHYFEQYKKDVPRPPCIDLDRVLG